MYQLSLYFPIDCYLINICIPYCFKQNDVSDIPDLTFSIDADEEKHILYGKNQVT